MIDRRALLALPLLQPAALASLTQPAPAASPLAGLGVLGNSASTHPALASSAAPSGAAAQEVALSRAGEQGAFVTGRLPPGLRHSASLDRQPLRISPNGLVAFGFGRDHPETSLLATGAVLRSLPVARRSWDVQHITGLPPGQVTPDAAALERIRLERERLAAVRGADTAMEHFAERFAWPARGRISGVFGSQRVLNGEPRQPHYGLDVAGPVGTPILAAAGGRVTLADDFHFFGKLVVLDHGHGVNTLYAHLSEIHVREGEAVARGVRIAAMGATGRVTGPHLHFSLSWFRVWLDPQPLLPT